MFDLLFQPISTVLNIKTETERALGRLGILDLRDLLFYKPTGYVIKNISPNLSALEEGTFIQAEVIIDDIYLSSTAKSPTRIQVSNATGSIMLVFFNKIIPFIFARLKIGSKHVICGKIQKFDRFFQITHPEFILQKSLESPIEATYPLTYGLVNKQIYSYILQGIKHFEVNIGLIKASNEMTEYLIKLAVNLKNLHLINISETNSTYIATIHEEAKKEIAYLELLANQMQLSLVRAQKKMRLGRMFKCDKKLKKIILDNLGFELTEAQRAAIKEIEADQCAPLQMMRLLQGDVGSGKTLVALLTMCNVIANNMQSVLMAPTDLLANQHFQFIQKAVADTDIKVGLLTGKITAKNRQTVLADLEKNKIDILVGTHALFQEKVNFKNLGYIVIDEQHRFGVEQRESLIKKASLPDVLVMTATPIPRSLTLTMFGDLSCSKLKSKPLNRLPIITNVITTTKIDEVAKAIAQKIATGEKVYWICPLVAAKENDETANKNSFLADAQSRFENLNAIYPNIVGLVHGKLRGNLKDLAMLEFKNGPKQILVATTVIEVGIDVADATLIVIENAEKFGLTQLHQLRGRVGRGNIQSHCILLYNSKKISDTGRKRLKIMRESEDGFYLAEQDLLLRGSGELLGKKQSGEPQFFFADITRDFNALTKANREAENIVISDFVQFQIKLFAQHLGTETKIS